MLNLGIWTFFSIIMGLSHLILVYFVGKVLSKPMHVGLLQDGSVLFFAVPITSAAYGEFYLDPIFGATNSLVHAIALIGLITIVLTIAAVYFGIATISSRSRTEAVRNIRYFTGWATFAAIGYALYVTSLRLGWRA